MITTESVSLDAKQKSHIGTHLNLGGTSGPSTKEDTPPVVTPPGDDDCDGTLLEIEPYKLNPASDVTLTAKNRAKELEEATIEQLEEAILQFHRESEKHVSRVKQSAANALVNAWHCGKLLIRAKEQLDHGEFGKWRDEKFVTPELISKKTVERYMKIARKLTIDEISKSGMTLTGAYVKCDLIKKDPAPPAGDSKNKPEKKTPIQKWTESLQEVTAKVTSLQQELRKIAKERPVISEEDKTRLRLAKHQIQELIDSLTETSEKKEAA